MYSRLDLMMMATSALVARDKGDVRWIQLLAALVARTGLAASDCEARIVALSEGRANG